MNAPSSILFAEINSQGRLKEIHIIENIINKIKINWNFNSNLDYN